MGQQYRAVRQNSENSLGSKRAGQPYQLAGQQGACWKTASFVLKKRTITEGIPQNHKQRICGQDGIDRPDKSSEGAIGQIKERNYPAVCRELTESYPELAGKSLTDAMIGCVEKSGKEFVFIIDEWDALIREAKSDGAVQKKYLSFLRGWFKNSSFTPRVVAAAYMTGILPIKKDGSQSAISDFKEVTILYPGRFTEFTGFTEKEVRLLCEKYGMDFIIPTP